MRVFRLSKSVYSASVLSGEGGLAVDGRWHERGRRIVYCASSEALAVLELRVHLGRVTPVAEFTMHAIDVPDDAIAAVTPDALPEGWERVPGSVQSQRFGSDWLVAQESLALRVPSVHSATDYTILVNPAHPDIGRVRELERRVYRFDGRLF